MHHNDELPALLDTESAARFLSLAARTLENWRCLHSEGPRFVKVGRSVRYERAELVAWATARRFRSTSEADHAARAA